MKFHRTHARLLFAIVAVLGLVFVLSCSGDKSTDTGGDDKIDRTTAESLLISFAKTYKAKDLDGYDECLHEDFVFAFTPDIADSLGLPPEGPWWGKTEDLNSTEIMFGSPSVTDIAFSYEYHIDWYACEDVRADTTYSGLCCRLGFVIEVTTLVSGEDPILKFRVDSSWLDVMVVPDPNVEGLWCILRIQEFKKQILHEPVVSGSAATEPSTWSGIKSMWQ